MRSGTGAGGLVPPVVQPADGVAESLAFVLAGSLDVVRALQDPGADAVGHRPVPLHQRGERGLVRPGRAAVEKPPSFAMALFRHFPKLAMLNIVGSEVSDAGLVHLKDVSELQELILDRDHVTEAGIAHQKDVKKLNRLTMIRSGLTDKGFEQLGGVKRPKHLTVSGQKITAAALGHLKTLPALKRWGSAGPASAPQM